MKIENKMMVRSLAILWLLCALPFVAKAADTKVFNAYLKQVGNPCAPGVAGFNKAQYELWVNTGADISLRQGAFSVVMPAGFTCTPSDVVINNGEGGKVLVDGSNYSIIVKVEGSNLTITLNAGQTAPAVANSTEDSLVATISLTVDDDCAGTTQEVKMSVLSAVGLSGVSSITSYISPDCPVADKPQVVETKVLSAFDISVVAGAKFETKEDVEFTVDVATDSRFERSAFVNGKEVKDYTDVQIIEAFAHYPNGTRDQAYYKQDGATKISHQPRPNFNGEVTIKATVSGNGVTRDIEFPLTITPVNDAPVITRVEVSGSSVGQYQPYDLYEGSEAFVTFHANDIDSEELDLKVGDIVANSYLKIKGQTYALEVGSYISELAGSDENFMVTLITKALPYDICIHGTESDSTYTTTADDIYSFVITDDKGAASEVWQARIPVNVSDTDRDWTGYAAAMSGTLTLSANDIKADGSTTVTFAPAVKDLDDEDWKNFTKFTLYAGDNSYGVLTGADLDAGYTWTVGGLEKGTYTLKVNVDGYADSQDKAGVATADLVVSNSDPTMECPASVFIQKGGDKDYVEFDVTVTDIDDVDTIEDAYWSIVGDEKAERITVAFVTAEGTREDNVVTRRVKVTIGDMSDAEFDDGQFTINYGTDTAGKVSKAVKVMFMTNPPPVFDEVTPSVTSLNEVDEAGNASTFTVTVKLSDTMVGNMTTGATALRAVKSGETNSWIKEDVTVTPTGTTDDKGNWSGTATIEITTDAYETVKGAGRAANEDKILTLEVVDVYGGGSITRTQAITFNINDVDRAPTGTVNIVKINATPVDVLDTNTTSVEAAITGLEEGDKDADEDAVKPYYSWENNGEVIVDWNETASTAIDVKKGQKLTSKVILRSAPAYAATALKDSTDGFASKSMIVGNVAPVLTADSVDDGTELEDGNADGYSWTVAELPGNAGGKTSYTLTTEVVDQDIVDGVDTVKYQVEWTSAGTESAGTVEIDDNGKVTYTPAEHYNNKDKPALEFTITVTENDIKDADGNTIVGVSDAIKVTLNVTEYNDTPVVKIADQYILPDQRGQDQTITVSGSMINWGDKFEDYQGISAVTVEASTDPDYSTFFKTAPAVDYTAGQQTFTITYTVAEGIELGKSMEVKLSFTDNGTTAGADAKATSEATFTIYVGATPWYPVIDFECANTAEHTEGHAVKIADADGNQVVEVIVKDDTVVLPGDYLTSGFKGFKSEAKYSYAVYPWTQASGASEEDCVAADEQVVPTYDLPAAANNNGNNAITADEDGWFQLTDISVPMSQSYTLTITDSENNQVGNAIKKDFTAREDKQILPEIANLWLQLTEPGEYNINVVGQNPMGEGATVVAVCTVTVNGESTADLAWSDDSFQPVDNAVLHNSTVKFSWPVASGATKYTLKIYDELGVLFKTVTTTNNDATVELVMLDDKPVVYSWKIEATNGSQTIEKQQTLTLVEKTDEIVIAKMNVVDGALAIVCSGALNAEDVYEVDCQYFSIADNKWYNKKLAKTTAENQQLVVTAAELGIDNVEKDDFVVVRVYKNGVMIQDWTAYQIFSAEIPKS